jgi:phosphopantothenoylcysteine decarboxylase/phosphopantothenate--cysteine ligase
LNRGSHRIILGVTGSIAAYKSLDLIRRFDEEGVSVRVAATRNARPFFPFLTAEVFSGHPVMTNLFAKRDPDLSETGGVLHLSLLEGTEALLIAPASADFIAKMALGLADDLLSTIALSATVPIFIAPAMEEAMYRHPASAAHRKTLAERGVIEIVPERGPLASGKTGLGRMADTNAILSRVLETLRGSRAGPKSFAGLRILISSGPTFEPIDAVRFIGNRSSGRMGDALARAALDLGARVTLVSGPTSLPPPPGAELHSVSTAMEMEKVLREEFGAHQVLIMAAAVSDYRVAATTTEKKKKDGKNWTLELVENPDILKGLAESKKNDQFVIGFAAESTLDPKQLLAKCRRKNVDLLVANDISNPDTGFGSSENAVTLVFPDGTSDRLDRQTKSAIAQKILDRIPLGKFLKNT